MAAPTERSSAPCLQTRAPRGHGRRTTCSYEVVRNETALDIAHLAVLDVPRQESGSSLRQTRIGTATAPADIELPDLRVFWMPLREPNRNPVRRHERPAQVVPGSYSGHSYRIRRRSSKSNSSLIRYSDASLKTRVTIPAFPVTQVVALRPDEFAGVAVRGRRSDRYRTPFPVGKPCCSGPTDRKHRRMRVAFLHTTRPLAPATYDLGWLPLVVRPSQVREPALRAAARQTPPTLWVIVCPRCPVRSPPIRFR